MKRINLSGATTFLTLQNDRYYTVVEGTLLIYAVRLNDGEPGRRNFIAEVEVGGAIPAMYIKDDDLGEWSFLFVSIKSAVITEHLGEAEKIIVDFAKSIDPEVHDAVTLAHAVVEKVNLNFVMEERYLYEVSKEQEETYTEGLSSIYNFFKKSKDKTILSESGHALYDTVAFLCFLDDIPLIPFDTLKNNFGRRFTLDDITRMSHFISREVTLSNDWHRGESGNFLVYKTGENTPYACIRQRNGYYLVNLTKRTKIPVNDEIAEEISHAAHSFYRPFENKAIGAVDLVKFGLKAVKSYDIFNIFIFALLGTVIGVIMPTFNERIFDDFIPIGSQEAIVQLGFLMLSLAAGNLAFTIVKNLAIFRSSNRVGIAIQGAVFDRLYNMPVSTYSRYESADLAERAFAMENISKLLSEVAVSSTLSAVFSLFYAYRMHNYSSELFGAGIVLVLINMAVVVTLGLIQIKQEKSAVKHKAEGVSILYQLISAISKIRIAGVENRSLLQYLTPYLKYKKSTASSERITNFALNINIFLGTAFSCVFYYMMVNEDLGLSIGKFMGFTSAFGSFSAAMVGLVAAFLQMNNVVPIYERAKAILNTEQEHPPDAVALPQLEGRIEVNNLSFRYSPESELVLKDVSFNIKPGEYVGVVGSSGCGKSTLLKLLLGFEESTLGKIYYDDKDIDSLDKRELRKKMGVVLQDGQLITGSIYENITITANKPTNKQVSEVIASVGMKKDINEMPMGVHTVVSEGGGTLSGGQRQRLLIARAIINKPGIIFFDEATSALDNVNQALVCESIEKLGATRVVIAHRLSTVINCDRIIVLNDGVLEEQGSYDELMEKKGVFYQLAVRQVD